MTYPPQYPAYPPPAQQPGYPPQQGYPPAQGYPPPPQQPGYPAPPQYAAPAAAAPLARGSIDDFYGQPTASGKSLSFDRKPPGTAYAGYVARTITHADIQQQTDIRRTPLFHPDGRPKYVMIVPLQMQPSAEFPDGRAAWYVKGADRVELERAMEAAGLPSGTPPEAGAQITITYTGDRPIPGLNAQKVKTVAYQRPAGAPHHAASQQQLAMAPEPAGQATRDMVTGNGNYPVASGASPAMNQQPAYAMAGPPAPQDQPPWQQPAPEQHVQAPAHGQYTPQAAYQQATGQPAPQQYAPPPQQQAPAQQPMQAPPGLSPEQQAALAAITGQQQ